MEYIMEAQYHQDTLGSLVAQNPIRSQVFEKWGLDYCCGGRRSLEEACSEKQLDVVTITHEIRLCDRREVETSEADWMTVPLSQLVTHIVQTHHAYLYAELSPLAQLLEKVARVHGKAHPELKELQTVFTDFKAEVNNHLIQEETLLFPLIQALEAHAGSPSTTLQPLIESLHSEHDTVGQALSKMREITENYAVPDSACNSYRALFSRLLVLESDLHLHIHKENNILFPRVQSQTT